MIRFIGMLPCGTWVNGKFVAVDQTPEHGWAVVTFGSAAGKTILAKDLVAYRRKYHEGSKKWETAPLRRKNARKRK